MYECFHCGTKGVIWDSDFSFEDYGLDRDGIIHECHCINCGADITYYIPIDTDEDEDGQGNVMKKEDVIRILKSLNSDAQQVINIALIGVEKQIPLPLEETRATLRCPRCKKQVTNKGVYHSKRQKYCKFCGQAFDWENTRMHYKV